MDHQGIRRNGKLYNKQDHTYKWTHTTPVLCDVIWEFDWVDIPEPIQNFIVARAAKLVSGRIVGDTNQYTLLEQQEAFSRSTALEYDTQQGQYTFFGHPQDQQNYYQSYEPYQALKR